MKKLTGFPEYDYSIEPRRGYTEVECEDTDPILWPNCEITGCENGICVGMSNSLCYPHGIEFGEFTKEQFEANRKARHSK
jgi:hypothetical protein